MSVLSDVELWLNEPHSTTADKVHELLDSLGGKLPGKNLVSVPSRSKGTALVLGDIHGDLPLLRRMLMEHFERAGGVDLVVTLGDYVDRTPEGAPFGSLMCALYVLALAARNPGRFIALRGNHETQRHVPAQPSELDEEVEQLLGDRTLATRIWDRIEELPLAATTENGVYLAHAGFPMDADWKGALAHPVERTYLEVVWNDVDASPICGQRGIDQVPISEETLSAFLDNSESGIVVRGHDPYVAGLPLYHDRLMTVHTTRSVVRTGIFALKLPLDGRLRSLERTQLLRVPP